MKSKAKKIVIGSTCAALVAAISVGGTLAYLTAQTEDRTNNFTFSDNALSAVLTESDWDGIIRYDVIDGKSTAVYGDTDQDQNGIFEPVTTKPMFNANGETIVYGEDVAKNILPGEAAKKNPVITNTCDIDEWVAAKVTFVYADGTDNAGKQLSDVDLANVLKVIEIDYDTNSWTRKSGDGATVSQVFCYNDVLESGDQTAPLFKTVTVDEKAETDDIDALAAIGGFAIYVEGYAAQGDAFENNTEFVASTLTFENTPEPAATQGN